MSNTSVPAKVHTFSAGQTIASSQVNKNFDDLFAGLADIGTANLLDAAISTPKVIDGAVTLAKLAAAVQNALCPAGTVLDYIGSTGVNTTAPTGWVLASGRTIGNAASGGTERANADTETLFTLIYNSMANAEAAVSGGRGASAAADFAANKTIVVPDLRGRASAGFDFDNGGGLASRLTAAGAGFDGAVKGKAGGVQTHTLVSGEMPSHTHVQDAHTHTQNAHTHTDSGHTHTDAGHTHGASDSGHTHTVPAGVDNRTAAGGSGVRDSTFVAGSATSGSSAAVITINNASAVIGSGGAVISSVAAVNQNATATNQSTGGNGAHSSTQPTYILSKIIKL